MTEVSFGDRLYKVLDQADADLYRLGELSQLSQESYRLSVQALSQRPDTSITLNYPMGKDTDGKMFFGSNEYPKQALIELYKVLANQTTPLNGLYQIVTIMEAVLGDIVRLVIQKYPKKLGDKRKIDLAIVLSGNSIEAVQHAATDTYINELSYKNPLDFAKEFHTLVGVNLLELPAYHQYVEAKATRDIHIHNNGMANEIYCAKSGSHSRTQPGAELPVDIDYFIQSYKYSLFITGYLKDQLHEIWDSSLQRKFIEFSESI